MSQHRVQAKTTETRLPGRPVWVIPQASDEREGVTSVVGTEQCRRLHSGPHGLGGIRSLVGVELPHRDEFGSDICGERHRPCARFAPREASVVARVDIRAELSVVGGGEKTPGRQLNKSAYALTG